MVKDQHPQAVKEAIGTVLPVWLEAFKILLNIDPTSDVSNCENWDGLAVRIQIFKVRRLGEPIDFTSLFADTLDNIHIISQSYRFYTRNGFLSSFHQPSRCAILHIRSLLYQF